MSNPGPSAADGATPFNPEHVTSPGISALEHLRNDHLLLSLLENIPDVIYVKDLEGRYQVDNRAHRRLLGVTGLNNIVDKTVFDFFQEAEARLYQADDHQVLSSGEPQINVIEKVTDSEGTLHWISTSKVPLYTPQGGAIGLIGIGQDVTPQMKTQQALEQEKYILDALMERIPDFIYFKDKESHFIRVNHALAERIGVVSPGEIIGKSDFDLFTEEHAQEAYADEKLIIETGESLLGKEEKENWVDGKLTWSSSSKMPLFDSGGQVVGTFGMSRDMTQQKQDQLRLAEYAARLRDVNERMQEDLRLASELQFSFLPSEYPTFPSSACKETSAIGFAHHYQPCGTVGGDFFSVRPLSDTTAAVFLCDVMGHGVRSALVTGIMRTLLADLYTVSSEPGLLLTQMNQKLQGTLRLEWETIFATATCLVLNSATGTLQYAVAGHSSPLLIRSSRGTVQPLRVRSPEPGPALGLAPDAEYWTDTERLLPGDRIVLFTDGLQEAMNEEGEFFGEDQFLEAVQAERDRRADLFFEHILRRVMRFQGREDFEDDVCMLAVELRRLQ